jgi:hypothetical protein
LKLLHSVGVVVYSVVVFAIKPVEALSLEISTEDPARGRRRLPTSKASNKNEIFFERSKT